jgi:hypothetical protein
MRNRHSIGISVTAVLAIFCFTCQPTARAQDYSHIKIVRLSFVEGDAQYQRPGGDWEDAKLNLPIQQGFRLQTTDGYAEVEFEQGLAMRVANNSSIEFTELSLVESRRVTKLNLSAGTAVITARLSRHDELSITTPNLRLAVPHSAGFRVDASSTENWVTVFHGKIDVESGAEHLSVGGGRTLHKNVVELSSLQIVHAPARDGFDKWVSQREQALSDAQSESDFQNKYYTTGFADLSLFGSWADIRGFGWGWQPYGGGLNWTPFVAGQWMFMGNTGWNWVSDEPWGWLPYHFGSWLNAPGVGWMWVPQGALYWQPATATWVRSNNQIGWMPNAAAPIKPLKSSNTTARASRVIILASGAPTGSIKAAQVMAVTQTQAATSQIVSAPAPGFTPQSGHSSRPANPSLSQTSVTGLGAIVSLQSRGPASLAAPKLSSPVPNSPRSLAPPRSLPTSAPRVFRSSGGISGGFYGANRSGGPRNPTGGISAGGAAAHSAGASTSAIGGAAAGHR